MENRHSDILEYVAGLLYSFIIIYGIYIIVYGDVSPGGGFQGGAILASVFMVRFLVNPEAGIDTNVLKTLEKFFYITIILLATIVILRINIGFFIVNSRFYLILMNFFIGMKVFFGLTIIFFKFAYVESGDLHA